MAYVLEKFTPEDLQKVINDADPGKQRTLRYAQQQEQEALTSYRYLPTHWAIDREPNCYVLKAPMTMLEDSVGQPYYLFAHGRMYKFRRNGMCGFQFYFDGRVAPPQEELLRAQQEFELAMRCHGSHGDDSLSYHESVTNISFLPPLDVLGD